VRHSFPYGTVSEAGLFFIAYTRDLQIPGLMLSRMIGTSGDGVHDRLMEFSRAMSGGDFLRPLARSPAVPGAVGRLAGETFRFD
jgi:putative iron-dependent peroxidase